MTAYDYIRDPAEIYRQSFATVEAEAGIHNLPGAVQAVVKRLIHSCGMVDVIDDFDFSQGAISAGQSALKNGCAIFSDVEMVKAGVITRLLPANNQIVCTLNREDVPQHAAKIKNTRSAAAVDLWGEDLEGGIVVIGNAPT
ncbi:MAG: precorrin-8X methylmutase, partial [Pseudomonadota bacterium]